MSGLTRHSDDLLISNCVGVILNCTDGYGLGTYNVEDSGVLQVRRMMCSNSKTNHVKTLMRFSSFKHHYTHTLSTVSTSR